MRTLLIISIILFALSIPTGLVMWLVLDIPMPYWFAWWSYGSLALTIFIAAYLAILDFIK